MLGLQFHVKLETIGNGVSGGHEHHEENVVVVFLRTKSEITQLINDVGNVARSETDCISHGEPPRGRRDGERLQ